MGNVLNEQAWCRWLLIVTADVMRDDQAKTASLPIADPVVGIAWDTVFGNYCAATRVVAGVA